MHRHRHAGSGHVRQRGDLRLCGCGADQAVALHESHPPGWRVSKAFPCFRARNLSYLDYLDWKKLNKVFSSLDVYERYGYSADALQPARNQRAGARVSDGFFRTLGVDSDAGARFLCWRRFAVRASHGDAELMPRGKSAMAGRPDVVGQSGYA